MDDELTKILYQGCLGKFEDDGSFRLIISLDSPLYKNYIEGRYRQDTEDPTLWIPTKNKGE